MTPLPPDPTCRALVGDSTRHDATVDRCDKPVTWVIDDTNNDGGYWSIWCWHHRAQDRLAQVCGDRDPEGNRRVGPQRILKGQAARG